MITLVPKIVGADVELSNFILGVSSAEGTGKVASRLLLAGIDGIESGVSVGAEALDWGRKYLPSNACCAYIDSDHVEIALAETFSAFDQVAYWRAMLNVVRQAMRRVNERLPDGCRVQVLANCSDGLGNSYGSHLNVLLTRSCWNNIMSRKPHYLAYLAAFQISSIVYTGQGKVGVERDLPDADFQLSQRADFIQTISHIDTMHTRGVINTRDEAHCGSSRQNATPALARLHVIFFDSTLCQVASVLRVGVMQMIAVLLEAGEVDPRLALDDPLDALGRWSRDPTLAARASLVDGSSRTAVELQFEYLAAAERFARRGGFEGIVPEWSRLLALWESTLRLLERRDLDAASRRLDWVAKHRLLSGLLDRRHDLDWSSPVLKQLDQLYASIDDADGPFWALENAGHVERVVTQDAVERAGREPPDDTRAWTRAHLLRLAGDARVERIDWDRVHVRVAASGTRFGRKMVVQLPVPHGDTRADNEHLFLEHARLESVVEALRATNAPLDLAPGPTMYDGRFQMEKEQ